MHKLQTPRQAHHITLSLILPSNLYQLERAQKAGDRRTAARGHAGVNRSNVSCQWNTSSPTASAAKSTPSRAINRSLSSRDSILRARCAPD